MCVVGEILVKYHPTANNNVVNIIEDEGGEAVVPGLLDYFTYGVYDFLYRYKYLAESAKNIVKGHLLIFYMESVRRVAKKALEKSKRFSSPISIFELARKTKIIMQLGNHTGEGWLLTGEMIELINMGASNIICMQPFAFLPNHIVGKGMIKEIKKNYPNANIAAIDYDPGASEVNQLNRIKLMMSVAFRKMNKN